MQRYRNCMAQASDMSFYGSWDTGVAEMSNSPPIRLLMRKMEVGTGSKVLDYGSEVYCLPGDLCTCGCRVIGIYFSWTMQKVFMEFLKPYKQFSAYDIDQLELMSFLGVRFDATYTTCERLSSKKPEEHLARIQGALKPGGVFLVLNEKMPQADSFSPDGEECGVSDQSAVWEKIADWFRLETAGVVSGGGDMKSFSYRSYRKIERKRQKNGEIEK